MSQERLNSRMREVFERRLRNIFSNHTLKPFGIKIHPKFKILRDKYYIQLSFSHRSSNEKIEIHESDIAQVDARMSDDTIVEIMKKLAARYYERQLYE